MTAYPLATAPLAALNWAITAAGPQAPDADPTDVPPPGWVDDTCRGCADVAWLLAESCPVHGRVAAAGDRWAA